MRKIHCYKQFDAIDCGPACLRMIARYYGLKCSMQRLREKCHVSRSGVTVQDLCDGAKEIGLASAGVHIRLDGVRQMLPCILHWDKKHYVVCYRIREKKNFCKNKKDLVFYIADPLIGKYRVLKKNFLKHWQHNAEKEEGTAIVFTEVDETVEIPKERENRNLFFYAKYLCRYKEPFIQIILGLIISSIIQILFPFITQTIVDVGIGKSDLHFVFVMLIVQIIIYCTQFFSNLFQSWLTMNLSVRMNLSILSDFIKKMLRLRIVFFESKKIGDILQRIGDSQRIEMLITNTFISTLFSVFNFVVFLSILWFYDNVIAYIFIIGHFLNLTCVFSFLKHRKNLDFQRFYQASDNQSCMIQMISGIQEIKLTNSEDYVFGKWASIQLNQYKIMVKSLNLGQMQNGISSFLMHVTNALIIYNAAKLTISGEMTLGMVMSIGYIVGQLVGPINQLIRLVQTVQDAQISLERLNEIYECKDEYGNLEANTKVTEDGGFQIRNVSFSYDGNNHDYVLRDINLDIPAHKTTVIVGESGSGKTTLLKLLAGFYIPNKGTVNVGGVSVNEFDVKEWRNTIGYVMQDGYIFSETIARNIAIGSEEFDYDRIWEVLDLVCLKQFVEGLPFKAETIIGADGLGVSQGQRQRILTARALYKRARFLFFDEATSGLDTVTEQRLIHNIKNYCADKTVVIVTHRLNLVKEADNIVVMRDGQVVECGKHDELLRMNGYYKDLLKKQNYR